jgi:acetate kinase
LFTQAGRSRIAGISLIHCFVRVRENMQSILVLNCGSSSVKAAIFEGPERKLRVEARQLPTANATLRLEPANAAAEERSIPQQTPAEGVATVMRALDGRGWLQGVVAVGHRIVHGGREFKEPTMLTPYVLEVVRGLIPLAPLHLPAEIAAMEEIAQGFPDLPQVLCFDTAFHRSLPAYVERYPLPQELHDRGVLRYGFHGLSYEWVVQTLQQRGALPRRMVVAHLGNGCSAAAVLDGRSVDTTLGMTALGGLPMATRPGDIDPGILLYLQRELGYSLEQVEQLLHFQSGLLGISGRSPDVQDLLALEAHDPRAALAIAMFCYAVSKSIGAFSAALGGVDAIVFTGGIGQYASSIRERVLARLGFLGAILDPVANKNNAAVISTADSAVRVEMIAANEEAMMAQHTARVFHAPGFLGRWQKERPILHRPKYGPKELALPRS